MLDKGMASLRVQLFRRASLTSVILSDTGAVPGQRLQRKTDTNGQRKAAYQQKVRDHQSL
jgi:hypothetical protein